MKKKNSRKVTWNETVHNDKQTLPDQLKGSETSMCKSFFRFFGFGGRKTKKEKRTGKTRRKTRRKIIKK